MDVNNWKVYASPHIVGGDEIEEDEMGGGAGLACLREIRNACNIKVKVKVELSLYFN
jgi:hypothetical protein